MMRTLVNSDCVNTLEALSLFCTANFSEDEACQLMCTLIDKAQKLDFCDIHGQDRYHKRRVVRFDINYSTDNIKGFVKAIDMKTKEVICEQEITRKKKIEVFENPRDTEI